MLTLNLSYLSWQKIFDDNFQNMFVYQPIFDAIELKNDKGTDYILSLKSKGYKT